MRKILTLTVLFLTLLSCSEKDIFIEGNIIPEPKKLIIRDNRLHQIKDVTILSSSENLIYPHNKDEYYLSSKNGNVVIEGNVIWAKQTLKQIADENNRIPDVEIHDWSAYPFRGFMHDTGRNFQTIDML